MLRLCVQLICLIVRVWRAIVSRRFAASPSRRPPRRRRLSPGQANLRPSFVDCSIVCPTRFGPCLSQHVTCAAICTQFTPCLPTRFQPQCPYPSEICTHVAGCQITNAVNCPVASGQACPQASLACPGQSLACGGFPGQPGFRRRGGICPERRFYISVELQPPSLVSSYAVGYLYVNSRPSGLQPHERRSCWV